jgi:hypothetical protein
MMQQVDSLDGQKPQFVLDIKNNLNDSVSIVIVHKDRPEFLNICLQSITVMSSNNNYEIIVVDNGSGPESQKFLDEIELTFYIYEYLYIFLLKFEEQVPIETDTQIFLNKYFL